jgi:hypothetical protein
VFLLEAEDNAGTALLYMRFEIVINLDSLPTHSGLHCRQAAGSDQSPLNQL